MESLSEVAEVSSSQQHPFTSTDTQGAAVHKGKETRPQQLAERSSLSNHLKARNSLEPGANISGFCLRKSNLFSSPLGITPASCVRSWQGCQSTCGDFPCLRTRPVTHAGQSDPVSAKTSEQGATEGQKVPRAALCRVAPSRLSAGPHPWVPGPVVYLSSPSLGPLPHQSVGYPASFQQLLLCCVTWTRFFCCLWPVSSSQPGPRFLGTDATSNPWVSWTALESPELLGTSSRRPCAAAAHEKESVQNENKARQTAGWSPLLPSGAHREMFGLDRTARHAGGSKHTTPRPRARPPTLGRPLRSLIQRSGSSSAHQRPRKSAGGQASCQTAGGGALSTPRKEERLGTSSPVILLDKQKTRTFRF